MASIDLKEMEDRCLDRLSNVYSKYLCALFKNSGEYYFNRSEKAELYTIIHPMFEKFLRESSSFFVEEKETMTIPNLQREKLSKTDRKKMCDMIDELSEQVLYNVILLEMKFNKQPPRGKFPPVYNLNDMDEVDVLPETMRYYRFGTDFPCFSASQKIEFDAKIETLYQEYRNIITLKKYEIDSEDELPELYQEFAVDLGHFEVKIESEITNFRTAIGISDDQWEKCIEHRYNFD